MRCTPSSSPLLLALAAVTLAACGSADRNNTGIKVTDAGFIIPDTGVINPNPDAGNNGNDGGGNNTCDSNPNSCVLHQLKGAFPACACLSVCETGYAWNAGTNACDVIGGQDGGTPDSGTPDSGVPFDGGPGFDAGFPDSGIPPPPTCTNNAGCNAGEECVDPQAGDLCAGQPDCICIQACVPNQATNACQAGEGCLWLWPGTRGLCVADNGGGTHAQPCTAQFDVGGNRTADSCGLNTYCLGASPTTPTGTCSRLCQPGDNSVCTAFGNYTCFDAGANPNEIGLCISPPPAFNDVGNSCTTNPNCMGNFCSQVLGGSCSYACGGLTQCPANSVCLNAGQEGPICVAECVFGAGGDATCNGKNPMTVCEQLGTAPDTIDVCIPGCTQDADCGAPPATCNTATGHCN